MQCPRSNVHGGIYTSYLTTKTNDRRPGWQGIGRDAIGAGSAILTAAELILTRGPDVQGAHVIYGEDNRRRTRVEPGVFSDYGPIAQRKANKRTPSTMTTLITAG